MQRILLVCNAVLALFLAIQVADGRPAAAAGHAPGRWTATDLRLLPIGGDDGSVHQLLLDLGAEVAGRAELDAETVDLGMRLEPAAQLRARFRSRTQVQLLSAGGLLPSRRYTLHFGKELRALDGRVLPAGTTVEFETARARLGPVVIDDVPGQPGQPPRPSLLFGFDQRMALAAVQKAVQLRRAGAPPRTIPATVVEMQQGAQQVFRLLPARDAELPDDVVLVVDGGLQPIGGQLPIGEEVVRQVALFEPLQLQSAVADRRGIVVQCNRRLPLPTAGVVTVEPKVDFQVVREHQGLRLVGKFQPGAVYAVQLQAGFPGSGRAVLRKEVRRSVLMPDHAPELELHSRGSVLSLQARPEIEVRGVNVKAPRLRVERVYPNNLVWVRDGRNDDRMHEPGPEHQLHIATRPNVEFRERIDLAALLGRTARGVYRVALWDADPAGGSWAGCERLLQVTDLRLSVRAADTAVAVQVLGVAGGEPVTGADLEVLSSSNQVLASGRTDTQGMALLRWRGETSDRRAAVVVARHGDDLAYVDLGLHAVELADDTLGGRPFAGGEGEAWLWPTRGIVRPGETVEVAVLLRQEDGGALVDRPVQIEFQTPVGRVQQRSKLRVPGSGLVLATAALSPEALCGRWVVVALDAAGKALGHATFEVAAFVPDRLEAEASLAADLRFGAPAKVLVKARWLDGTPAAGRAVTVRPRLQAGDWSPPGVSGFAFGNGGAVPPGELPPVEGVLGADGEGEFAVALPAQAECQSLQLLAMVEVQDPSGRVVRARATAPVLRPVHLGVRLEAGRIEVCARTPAGQVPAGEVPVTVRLERRHHEWDYVAEGSRWRWATHVVADVVGEWNTVVQQGRAVVETAFPPGPGWLVAVVQGAGTGASAPLGIPPRQPDRLRVTAPSAPVAAGGNARLGIEAPADGSAFVTVEGPTLLASASCALRAGHNDVDVAIPAGLQLPNVHVVVAFARPATAVAPGDGPAFLVGGASVPLLRPDLDLPLQLTAPSSVRPEAELPVAVDAPGATHALVAVVDEGVLAITGHASPDPRAFFLAARRLQATGADLGAFLLDDMVFAPGSKTGGDGGDDDLLAALAGAVDTRIRPLALCAELALDGNGHGTTTFRLPAYDGRVRVMVVAAGPRALGAAATATVVKAPLGLRAATPRQLMPGDQFVLPIVLHNDTGADGEVQLQLGPSPGIAFAVPPPQHLLLRQGEVRTVELACVASLPPAGIEPALEVLACLGDERRSLLVPVVVRQPAQGVVEYQGLRLHGEQELRLGDGFVPGRLRVELETSSSPDRHLRPALQALLAYPYGCLEQTASQGLALLACQALLPRLLADEAVGQRSAQLVQAAVDRIATMQVNWQGYGWWPGSSTVYGFGTVYATGFLLAAREAGADVADEVLESSLRAVQSILLGSEEFGLRCAAVEVLARAGRPVQGQLELLAAEVTDDEDRSRLALAQARLGDRKAAARLLQHDEAAAAGPRQDDGLLRSPVRAQALRFRARLAIGAGDPRLPVQLQELQQVVLRPERLTTQEQAQVLCALAEWFRAQPAGKDLPPPQLTLDGVPLLPAADGRFAFDCRPGQVLHVRAAADGHALLTLRGQRELAAGQRAAAVDVRRTWYDLDTGEPVEELRRGHVYLAEITVRGEAEMANLAVTDFLPGGVEAELPPAGCDDKLPDGQAPAAAAVQRRDDRVVLFPGRLPTGTARFVHRVRAVFPGHYQDPGLTVHGMYRPEVDGVWPGKPVEIKP